MDALRGRVAVVTGGASGIGRALAVRCVAEGMDVVVADIEGAALEATADEIGAVGIRTDVSDAASVQSLADEVTARFGRVDLLCNNAGVGGGGHVAQLERADWQWVLGVNLWGVIHGLQSFLPHLIANPAGAHIVNTASMAGLAAFPGAAPYCASKFAVVGLSESLQQELALDGADVGVSVLCPGFVRTNIFTSQRNRPDELKVAERAPLAAAREANEDLIRMVEATALDPAVVADAVLDAVLERRFWIFTHPELIDHVDGRHALGCWPIAGDRVIPPTIEWRGDRVALVDQRRLPAELVIDEVTTVDELCERIATLAVRGAPALGAAGAMGVALAHVRGDSLTAAADRLIATRPTAVNLAWGARRAAAAVDPVAEAVAIAADDVARCKAMGRHGAPLLPAGAGVLTHCNAGSLACVEWGTALGVIRTAHEQGTDLHVWVDETRPLLQGARITAWELGRLGIAHTLIPDVRAASLMAQGRVDCVIVGADRIAANGDVANKVGTYGLAVLAAHHGIPFYVAAPRSTHDAATADGTAIPIEQRAAAEVTSLAGVRIAPAGVEVDNAAFDVTPAALVSAYISEEGVEPGGRG